MKIYPSQSLVFLFAYNSAIHFKNKSGNIFLSISFPCFRDLTDTQLCLEDFSTINLYLIIYFGWSKF